MTATLSRRPAAVATPAGNAGQHLLVLVAQHSITIALALAFLLPFVFIVLTALMTDAQALSPRLWPSPFRWSNFHDVFANTEPAALRRQHDDLCGAEHRRRAGVERPGGLRAGAAALARSQRSR